MTVCHDPDGTPVVALAGQFDLTTAASAERAFAALAGPDSPDTSAAGPIPEVVVDMSDLTFMDSSGLTVLLRAASRGYAVRLRRPAEIVRRLIAATGLGTTLPVEP